MQRRAEPSCSKELSLTDETPRPTKELGKTKVIEAHLLGDQEVEATKRYQHCVWCQSRGRQGHGTDVFCWLKCRRLGTDYAQLFMDGLRTTLLKRRRYSLHRWIGLMLHALNLLRWITPIGESLCRAGFADVRCFIECSYLEAILATRAGCQDCTLHRNEVVTGRREWMVLLHLISEPDSCWW